MREAGQKIANTFRTFADKEEVDYSKVEQKFSKTELAKKPWEWQKRVYESMVLRLDASIDKVEDLSQDVEINRAKDNGKRVICVGTTSCRTVESAADENGRLKETSGWTEIFIYPGYQFKVLDCLITNFHLPESTLVMLVSALAGGEQVLAAYEEAIKERYRFFSFGDAMLIH